ncbi:MAG: arginine--tRNA ligase, partial [Sedimentisphaerales bacterium]|nr:arginine--tRNA ligase [Sedimentisphaerales bacterium]
MKTLLDILETEFSRTMTAVTGVNDCAAIVRPATDAKFGDYQVNGVMGLGKKLKTNPRKLAESVVEKVDVSDMCEPPEVAGPGFINLRLKPDYVATQLLRINADGSGRLGIEAADDAQTVVVDFSSPNVAKQMHVGHLRSTIIGDAICRLLDFLGHNVIRQNHIGDWGTQFGMLINYMFHVHTASRMQKVSGNQPQEALALEDTEELYRRAKKEYDSDPEFAEGSRAYVVGLQRGDPEVLKQWQEIVDLSMDECQKIYDRLGATLKREDVCGESFYNDRLSVVVGTLEKKALAVESDGAICVFPEGFKNKEGQALPFIIRKSDGAYLYATTDLAALRYRVGELHADKIVYVTDARQSLHFEMLFAVADMAGWDTRDGKKIDLSHVTFGSVLGENGKPLKTRSGENVKLRDLLDEAVDRAKAVVEEKNPERSDEEKKNIAEAVGIGAVKYADYSNNRESDYVFSFDKMLAMDGNTAPYMQYAYARIKSIERKAESKGVSVEDELADVTTLDLSEPTELDLAKHLIRYADAIESAATDYRPNYLTSYLYELAQKFSAFYTNCPVLDAPAEKRPTRLLL